MARSSPQSFEKRQRERSKAQKRAEKIERRLIRNEEKRRAKEDPNYVPRDDVVELPSEDLLDADAAPDASPDA